MQPLNGNAFAGNEAEPVCAVRYRQMVEPDAPCGRTIVKKAQLSLKLEHDVGVQHVASMSQGVIVLGLPLIQK